jgi:hypothetical protein
MTSEQFAEPGTVGHTVLHHSAVFNVDLMLEPRRPVVDPTLGIAVAPLEHPRTYSRRLVALGDSLTQGFHHFAIHDTEISWPVMVAERMGLTPGVDFTYPLFGFPGGYPFNLEDVLRRVEPGVATTVYEILQYARQVRSDYAPEPTPVLPTRPTPQLDNLAVWGWDVRDLLSRTAKTEIGAFKAGWFVRLFRGIKADLIPFVDHAENRTGVAVLTEFSDPPQVDSEGQQVPELDLTALDLAERRGSQDDGIETLVIAIGSNNVLGVVSKLKILPSKRFYRNLWMKSRYNVWKPKHFLKELLLLEHRVQNIRAEHVIWATVPHVTIPPITHGLPDEFGTERLVDNPRYFQYYGRPWETPESFDHLHDANLTGMDAWTIDSVIDAYNDSIVSMVRRARAAGRDWRIVDMCAVLDRLAIRRNDATAGQPYPYLPPYELPVEYPPLNSRFLDVNPDRTLAAGGIFGLDGVHPTTAGYGLIAREFMKVMYEAGVDFPGVADPAIGPQPEWTSILSRDTLLADPPVHVGGVLHLIRTLQEEWDFVAHGRWL